ncbi:MAG: DUF512 domain-containing protein [Bacillota bacterium]
MKHRIVKVDQGSIADEIGVLPGTFLHSIDEEPIRDVIDYEHLTAKERLTLTLETPDGELYDAEIEKDVYEPLGLTFESGLMSPLRSCKNHCVFCFIDQMPKGVRKSLQVKDDDWRLSLIMGNYVTLTNVDDEEFARILRRRVSPLYVSVHAVDPQVRIAMMKNPTAGRLLERLEGLRREGLKFHAQVVLCPGVNDGDALKQTIETLGGLYPSAQSLAVVPVGLTRHREGLPALRVHTPEEAAQAVKLVEGYQSGFFKTIGTRFVFASDEFYLKAGLELPAEDAYEEYPQLENGVGLVRKFESEALEALEGMRPLPAPVCVDVACGVSVAPYLEGIFQKLEPFGVKAAVHAISNGYFGETVTVSGLVTARDLIDRIPKVRSSDALLIPHTMLREGANVFLDGMTKDELEQTLCMRVVPLCANDGERFVRELWKSLKAKPPAPAGS